MQFQLDFRSGQPIYLQIVDQIRQKVASGELKPGDQLPTVRQMATDLRVNFNTVARAYRILDESGLISTQQGRGTYIWDTPPGEVDEMLRQEALESLTRRFLHTAQRQGYTPVEVQAALDEQLTAWRRGDDILDE
ncbi:MAG: GntR family transcriptional regulator [Chloroflexi bacterium]|nr:GntR family transcriptional regulator [Chloroflexota bacterium]